MARSSASIAALCLAALLSTCSGFDIRFASLRTARLSFGPWRSNYVSNFSAPAPIVDFSAPAPIVAVPSSADTPESKPRVGESAKAKPSVQSFKFEYDDIQMISGYKSECLELVYSRSMDRGFVST